MKYCNKLPIVAALLCIFNVAKAQNQPIGFWESHLPYNVAYGVATDGNMLYTVCNQAFFTFDPSLSSGGIIPYSKVEGMSDIGMKCVAYDAATSTAVLVYANGNIDLFKDNTFYNIPDLKTKMVAGAKEVYEVYTENGLAYLSTSLGVLVVDIAKKNIKETYTFIYQGTTSVEILPVNSFIGYGAYFYAATRTGLFRAEKSSRELQNFQIWQKVTSKDTLLNFTVAAGKLVASARKKVYVLENDTLRTIYSSATMVSSLLGSDTGLIVGEIDFSIYRGKGKVLNRNFALSDSFSISGNPLQLTQTLDGNIWIADEYNGLLKRIGNDVGRYIPEGPTDASNFDIWVKNRDLWIAHGGIKDLFAARSSRSGLANLNDNKWRLYKEYITPALNDVRDIVSVIKDEKNNVIYGGSYLDGLVTVNSDRTVTVEKKGLIIDTSRSYFGGGERQLTGLTYDKQGNLWVTAMRAYHQLYVKTPEGQWYEYRLPGVPDAGGPVIADDNGQIWSINYDGGVSVFNPGESLENLADDNSYYLTAGAGFGNLPSNSVLSIAKDKNNNIWIGTANGIGIVNNCDAPFNQAAPCDADIPVVQYDQYAGYLFAGNRVTSIAVDGANRKWVGTDDGVWLLSPDASKIVNRFTAENSPLPSNRIQKIAIDDVTGDVYFGTEQGLVTYRSTATEGNAENTEVTTFPNPVPAGYSGTIAIKGLTENADVRITDVNGQLVYRTKALGGQAVWNGRDYTGRKPQTGVYLIFGSNTDGTQTFTGKLVFLK